MSETKDPTAPLLIVTGGPLDGSELAFSRHGEKTLGASPDCDLKLELGNVDPLHAGISWDAQGLVLTDMSSSTGTYVNGEKISGDHTLGDGDRVCLGPPGSKGSVKLLVRVPAGAAAAPAPDFSLSADEGPVLLESEEPFSLESDASAAGARAVPEPPLELEAAHEAPPVSVKPFQPEPPPLAAPPSAPAPEPPAPRKPAKPEYTNEMPSIAAPERSREAVALPPAAPREIPRGKRAKKGGLDLSSIPRPALIGAPVLLVCVVTWALFSKSQTPGPVLATIFPSKVETGGTVTITGKGFETSPAKNVVRFGDQTGTVTSASETSLAVTVPNVESGDRKVLVESRGAKSNQIFVKIFKAPSLTHLEPEVALPGEEVVADGMNLGTGTLSLSVGGQAAQVVQAGPTSIRFRVPQIPGAEGRTVSVSLQVGPDFAKAVNLILGHLPLVLSLTPTRAAPGEQVTLKGRGFDTNASGNLVSFGAQPALVLSATATEIVVCAPATDRQVSVTVQAHGRASSSPATFAMTRASSATFLLRYFPAPVTEKPGRDLVYVSTELGPTLLLGGKADAASTSERAMKVAAALNGVAEGAASAPVRLEARDKPPGVAVAGSTALLVAVTAEDAAAYEGHQSPRSVASFWTALLQDQLALFAMRERPTQLVQMTPRGRALTDIYAEAVRRSGIGAGVSQGILSPLSTSRAQALRELALLPPGEGQSASGAALEGTWDGNMDETGVGSRQIQVKFKMKGSQLTGTISTRSGKISADVPLSDVAMQGSNLSFARTSGVAPMYFRGTMQGASVTGTLHSQPGAKDAVGQFSLTFVE